MPRDHQLGFPALALVQDEPRGHATPFGLGVTCRHKLELIAESDARYAKYKPVIAFNRGNHAPSADVLAHEKAMNAKPVPPAPAEPVKQWLNSFGKPVPFRPGDRVRQIKSTVDPKRIGRLATCVAASDGKLYAKPDAPDAADLEAAGLANLAGGFFELYIPE